MLKFFLSFPFLLYTFHGLICHQTVWLFLGVMQYDRFWFIISCWQKLVFCLEKLPDFVTWKVCNKTLNGCIYGVGSPNKFGTWKSLRFPHCKSSKLKHWINMWCESGVGGLMDTLQALYGSGYSPSLFVGNKFQEWKWTFAPKVVKLCLQWQDHLWYTQYHNLSTLCVLKLHYKPTYFTEGQSNENTWECSPFGFLVYFSISVKSHGHYISQL